MRLKPIQYLGVMVFLLQIRGTKFIGAKLGPRKWIFNLLLFIFSPLVQVGTFLGFVFSWKRGDTKHEVEDTYQS